MNSLKSRVLCVEDDLDSCEMLTYMLSSTADAYDVTGVHHADQAMALISTRSFDLYVLDVWLRDIDGFELCRWIRRRDANVPIVFFTANGQAVNRSKAMEAGGDAFLIKPNDLDTLPATVQTLLRGNPRVSRRPMVRQAPIASSV